MDEIGHSSGSDSSGPEEAPVFQNDRNVILLVDDDEEIRRALRFMLEKNGYGVLEAETSHEALQHYHESSPALVLMDIFLPGDHGINAIGSLLAIDPDARIIAFSGLHQESVVRQALEAGACDFILKPFEIDELLASIREHQKEGTEG